MNKTYRILFNAATGTWVAASEIAKGRKKSGGKRALARSAVALAAVTLGLGATQSFAYVAGNGAQQGNANNTVIGDNADGSAAGCNSTYLPGSACSTIIGNSASATASATTVIGDHAKTTGANSIAIGAYANAAAWSQAIGAGAMASGGWATAIGQSAQATAANSTAIGTNSTALGTNSTALGSSAHATQQDSFAIGQSTNASAAGAMALGSRAKSTGANAVALGMGATTSVDNAVALGAGSVADRTNTISVGAAGSERQIVNVADGTEDTDAVNLSQLKSNAQSVATALGGGATVNPDGTVTAPSYTVQGNTYNNVGGALGAVDTNITNLQNSLTKGTRYFQATGLNDGTDNANAAAPNAVAIGSNAYARSIRSVAIGTGATTTASTGRVSNTNGSVPGYTGQSITNTAVGASSYASSGSTALGDTAKASGIASVAIGPYSTASSNFGVATGFGAQATGANSTALGANAQAQNAYSVALGLNSIADRDNSVSVGSAGSERQITNVAAGTAATDAVNVSQLHGANASVAAALGGESVVNPDGTVSAPSYTVDGTTVHNVGDAITNLDGRASQNSKDIADLTDNLTSGSIGLVQQDADSRAITVAKDTDGNLVDFTGKAGARQLTGVADGAVTANSLDAINGGQLHGVSTSVANALGGNSEVNPDGTVSAPNYTVQGNTYNNVGGALGAVDTSITNLQNNLTKGTRYFQANGLNNGTDNAIASAPNSVAIGSNANAKSLRAVAIGAGATTDVTTIRVNGTVPPGYTGQQITNTAVGSNSQAFRGSTALGDGANASGQVSVAIGPYSVASGNFGIAAGFGAQAAGASSMALGVSAQAQNAYSVALGKGSIADRDNSVSVGSAGNERQITNVAAGTAATDAVNVSQLHELTDNLSSGSIGLVQQDTDSRNITVAAGTDGTVVDFTGTAGARTLTGVADGKVADGSTDAVNGSQLYATNQQVAKNTGDISTINTNVTDLDGRVTTNATNITNLQKQIGDGSVGLVQQDPTTRNITVAAGTDGAVVDFTGMAGARKLTGVANGMDDHDAVNVSQLKQTGLIDNKGNALAAVTYDVNADGSPNYGSVTLGGQNAAGPVQLHNVADGTAATDAVNLRQLQRTGLVDQNGNTLDAVTYDAGSNRTSVTFGSPDAPVLLSNVRAGMADMDAANVGQLRGLAGALGGGAAIGSDGAFINPSYTLNNVTYTNVGDALSGLATAIGDTGDRVTVVEKVISTGEVNAHVVTSGDQANAATATGDNAVAVGAGASASNNNSVALGAGSTTTRDNTVSVGSVGAERIVANVADAVQDTDAVNKRTMDTAVAGAKSYTDQQVGMVQQALGDVSRKAYSGIAGATALTMIPDVDVGKTVAVGVGVGSYQGYAASAIGVSARLSERIKVKMGASMSGAGTTYGAGASYQW
ncbi:hemagglutinin family protein [Ralstonia insidiosa]|uniref:Hemagglutinin family protein n=1 Tax=Ralstonia insidiosa TaxID=190721 RepID=A0AAC9BK63_9RALS|nr:MULTISPECIES: YadA-like family protein [Ralstonia]ANH75643.1 hemagglutinin family protein [Ralstonia insidiosa]EPX99224.1 hypothetical protein C404_04515 [Ralstonia sp. AU12-08]MBY4707278.1 YadA-like family protein [Ralstonia insidiosa]GAQ26637.1 hemagglutinin-related protein [Ralstonia sp. NT80]